MSNDGRHERGRALSTTSSRGSAGQQDSETARQIAGLIGRLLVHYWTENMPASMREAQALDWLEDLREFGPELVSEACLAWRRQPGGKRPTPGDIRALCIRERQERGPAIQALPASAAEARDQYARSVGFESWADREAAIAEQELRFRKAEVWRIEQGRQEPHPEPRDH